MATGAGKLGRLAAVVTAIALLSACGTGTGHSGDAGAVRSPGTETGQDSAATRAPTPEAVPVEELRFTATTLEGERFSGESLAGRPVVLWFWAPWCPNCRAEAPSIARAAKAHEQVTFVGVASREEVGAMRDFVRDYGVDGFTHLDDGDGKLWQRFGITYQPAYAFISTDGTVTVEKQQLSESELADRLTRLAGA